MNAETRELVWRMDIDNTEEARWQKWMRQFNGEVKLNEGTYEVYFSTVRPQYFSFEDEFFSIDKLLKKLLGEEEDWRDQSDKWHITIKGVDEVYEESDVRKFVRAKKQAAIADLTMAEDDANLKEGFTLTQQLEIDLYGIGEGFKGKMYDYGWMINAKTREKVWEMNEGHSEYAGGAVKNRLFKDRLNLAAGSYLIYFKTDDSHSTESWNANPPYDPMFWGIMVSAADKDIDPGSIRKYEIEEEKPLVSINRVGDYAYKEEAFKLKQRAKIRIEALGEGISGDMYDFGWITKANTGEIVWKMRYYSTKHAGGASKNRLFDDVIILDEGNYILHYQSDDSHSFEDWNQSPPQNPDRWGISVYPIGNSDVYETLKSAEINNNQIIAQLTRVGNDEYLRKQFRIDQPIRVRIYAIGEGDWDEMYDYGWLKNVDSGNIVWKMRYRETRNAGGAEKNRMINTTIHLRPGVYRIHYRSDDSHSFNNWNSPPPYDQQNWGITIYRIP
ncbi:MAG: hypothetical protein GF313_07965 [Caldithrix sp.]|nr:hypothetical protein [Caldithrix sp.]